MAERFNAHSNSVGWRGLLRVEDASFMVFWIAIRRGSSKINSTCKTLLFLNKMTSSFCQYIFLISMDALKLHSGSETTSLLYRAVLFSELFLKVVWYRNAKSKQKKNVLWENFLKGCWHMKRNNVDKYSAKCHFLFVLPNRRSLNFLLR